MRIKDKEYKLKYTMRALFAFEQITQDIFQIKTIMDEYLFCYCILLANNDMSMTFEEFIAECDEDMNIMHEFKIFLSKEYKKQAMFYSDIENQSDKKKH